MGAEQPSGLENVPIPANLIIPLEQCPHCDR